MPNQDAFAILAQARQLGLQAASAESGAYENTSVQWRTMDLNAASAQSGDPTVKAALSTPQSPADPRWNRRLPQPPCEQCGNDHRGNRVYEHSYVHPRDLEEAQRLVDQYGNQIPQTQSDSPTPIRAGVEREIVRRVAIYDSRTGYIVKVEEPPEWDDVTKTKMDRQQLGAMLPVLKALGVRVKNNSEDDFEEETDGTELQHPAQAAVKGPATSANRAREDVAREWEELLPGTTPPSLQAADTDGAEQFDPNGQSAPAPRRSRTGTDG